MAGFRLRLILRHYSYTPVELLISLLTATRGFWLLLPLHTFGAVPAYGGLAQLVPEPVWGLVLCWAGLTMGYASIRRRQELRVWAAAVTVGLWAADATGMLISALPSTGGIQNVVISLATIWVAARASLDGGRPCN